MIFTLHEDARERELQDGLLSHLQQVLLEVGRGFAFLRSPYPLTVGGDEFEVDLLFYHLHLWCCVVINLKIGKFSPEETGQMNIYLSAVDDVLRHKADTPSIGLILCKTKNEDVHNTRCEMRTNRFATHLTREIEDSIAKEFRYSLPTIEEIEAEPATKQTAEMPACPSLYRAFASTPLS